MPRGYRLLIIALGLVLSGAKPPQERTQSQPSAKPAEQAAAQPYAPYAGYNPDPCYQSKDHDAADLCAQWRASMAAEKAAHEARRATNWAIVATLLSSATVIGLIVSLYQTSGALSEARRGNRLNMAFERRSRRENSRSAEEQAKALAISEKQFLLAERTAKSQIRCYLSVAVVQPYQTGDTFSAKIHIKNVGQTPARIKSVTSIFWISASQSIDPASDGPAPEEYYHVVDFLPQGATDEIVATCLDMTLAGKTNAADQADAYVYGRVDFTDVFGDEHWLTFASCPKNWGFDGTTVFRPCIHGNDSD